MIGALVAREVIAPENGWRWMFLVGALPALLVVFTMKFLREPEPWLRAKAEGRLPEGSILTPYRDLLRDRRWRKNLIIGALISSAGVIGLWAIVEYAIDIQSKVFRIHFESENMPEADIPAAIIKAKSLAYTLQMIGAAVGMWFMTKACIAFGRKPAFAIWYTGSLVVDAVRVSLHEHADRRVLDDAADVVLLAGRVCRLRDLFAGAVSQPTAEHGHVVLLQPGPLRGGRRAVSSRPRWRPKCSAGSTASSRRCASGTRRWRCAWCS